MPRYVIVGTGVAGISAVQAVRSQDSRSEVILIGDEPQGYYSRPGLAYYLSKEAPEELLFPFQEADFRSLNVRRVQGWVVKIDPADHCLLVQNGSLTRIRYDRLLLATGAHAAGAKVPGSELEGVVKLDNYADAQQIINLSRKARSAVVIGGGITALELVEGLKARGLAVTYLMRGDRYWGSVLDETESRIVEKRLQEEGVRIFKRTELAEIRGKNGRVVGILTRAGEQMRCEIVAIAIGVKARTALAASSGLETERGILVDECLHTSHADILAAGDAAQVYDPSSGKSTLQTLWTPARKQGWTAGLNLVGKSTQYRKGVDFNVTRLAGLTTTIIGAVGSGSDDDLVGIARGDSETWRQLPHAIAAQSRFDVNRVRILVGQRSLAGAVVMGSQTLSRPLQELISAQADVSPIRDRLLNPAEKLGDLALEFWNQWRQANAAQQP